MFYLVNNMKRQKKRTGKFRGTRNCGKGNAKNKRGKGNKGGWGRAGMHKHRYSYVTAYEPDFFGVHGFASIRKKSTKTINIYNIDQLARKGMLEQKEGMPYFEFNGKILGVGKINTAVTVKALAFSPQAAKKIKDANGKTIEDKN